MNSTMPRPLRPPDARTLRIIGFGMAAGVVLVSAVAIGLTFVRATPSAPPSPLAWLLCGAAIVALAAGWAIPIDGPRRRVVALALREATGLIGALITLWTGSPTWSAALGLLSVAAILAGIAAVPDEAGRAGASRLG